LTKAELISRLAETTGMKRKDLVTVVNALVSTIAQTLKRHEKVQISGFGTFEPRRRRARAGRNPQTQEAIRVAASWSLGFRPAKQLKAIVAGKAGGHAGRR